MNWYFKTWMTKILINNCYGIIRNNKRIIYTDELPEKVSEEEAGNIEWREAFSTIDEKYRIALILLGGFSYKRDRQNTWNNGRSGEDKTFQRQGAIKGIW